MRLRRWRPVIAVAALALAGAAAVLVLADPALYRDVVGTLSSVHRMKEVIASWGVWAPLASMALMVIHSFVPFPAEILAVVNGMLFGLALGTAITWSGAMLGALLAFGVARWLGRDPVRRLLGPERWRKLESLTAGYGAKTLLLARLTPVVAFNLVNYAAGLAGVGWWTFVWTTAVGILPITMASVLVGSHMTAMPWPVWLALFAAVAGLMALHWWFGGSHDKRNQPRKREGME